MHAIPTAILAIFAIFDIHRPTPVKGIWLALTLLSICLRLIAMQRVRLRAFGIYILATILATLLQSQSSWNLAAETLLALALAGFVGEIVALSVVSVPYAAARRYDREFSYAGIALIAAGMLIYTAPAPYPGYPRFWYYTRLCSTAIACCVLIATAALAYSTRVRMPRQLRAHGLLAICWLAAVIWAGIAPRTLDRWMIGIIATGVQVTCLIAWISVGNVGVFTASMLEYRSGSGIGPHPDSAYLRVVGTSDPRSAGRKSASAR